MCNQERMMKKIREKEEEIAFASPKKAAKLASEIVRLKGRVFD